MVGVAAAELNWLELLLQSWTGWSCCCRVGLVGVACCRVGLVGAAAGEMCWLELLLQSWTGCP